MSQAEHKAGFVSIIGKPNAGKSTLMNVLVGENLSIITAKAQTTRHRIQGIINGDDFQIIYSDTPGIIKPKYELQKSMMKFVETSLEGADILCFVVDAKDEEYDEEILKKVKRGEGKLLVVLNKVDLLQGEEDTNALIKHWEILFPEALVVPVSALHKFNVERLFQIFIEHLPVHPPYYDKDELTDMPERFFASEIIREKIFINYSQEIPYATDVVITAFKERENNVLYISAEILVERPSQKSIIIGKGGSALKKVGVEARKSLEDFYGKKIFLETFVKVEPDWRKHEGKLRKLGYSD